MLAPKHLYEFAQEKNYEIKHLCVSQVDATEAERVLN
jgi:hypothetical protein